MPHLDSPKVDTVESNPKFDMRIKSFSIAVIAVTLAFIYPLFELVKLSLGTELYSHILLIPGVSIYFAWSKRKQSSETPFVNNHWLTLSIITIAAALLCVFLIVRQGDGLASIEDFLAITILPYVLLVGAAGIHFLGLSSFKRHLFSFAFLIFLIPIPLFLQYWINTFFQYTSAELSYLFIKLAQIPIHREHPLVFELPTIFLQVAPECSGIRSSLVLLITSIVAGELFLDSKWKRLFLALFVIPLAIFRNGLRIMTIAYLCVEIGPEMIDSWIHRHGGPLFFLVSLIPFFAILLLLSRLEARNRQPS